MVIFLSFMVVGSVAFETSIIELKRKGYEISVGEIRFSRLGEVSQPEASYGSLYFRDEVAFPDKSFCECIEKNNQDISKHCKALSPNSQPLFSNETQCGGTFVLGPSDAIIAIFAHIPAALYFSLQTNIDARFATTEENGVWYPQVAPGDAVNQLSGNISWNDTFAIISTADATTANDLTRTLAPVVPNIILEPLNFSAFRFWYGNDWRDELPDTIRTLLRFAVPLNNNTLPTQSFSLLIRIPPSTRNPDPLNVPALRPRIKTGNTTENQITNLSLLSDAVISALAKMNCYQVEPTITMTPGNIDDPMPLLQGDLAVNYTSVHYTTRDAYYASASTSPHAKVVPLNDILVAVGAASTALEKSTFDDLAISNENISCFLQLGRLDCTPTQTDRSSRGSAAIFLPQIQNETAFAVAWALRKEFCQPWVEAVPAACTVLNTSLFFPDSNVSALYRAYLNPISQVGASSLDMALPRLFSFRCN
eukprot:CAMPEP_0197311182 /NCGR_PEP_ID=MMETSP0891-20130614/9688_1 /TAXON_ID=44058 ORGANISM="Aureoumbra lagunensis, Strain CCMP1510" /NCGR_SAMPLE_ID=MMETSP0891 /ASSEMBLY_ACC=CAM_ASM_000534 /LENGTH=478 /DNA_ID=CAMNT_0042797163 /DNA_START=72 /DNA_END=1508 /DNA_ORIENTATION=-